MSKRVLITGHKGFVGRHFAKYFRNEGWTVDGLDIVDGDDCRRYFSHDPGSAGRKWDLVVHCAANVGGRARIDGDPLAVAKNLAIDSDMFRWAARTRQPRVVYFSTQRPTLFSTRTVSRSCLWRKMTRRPITSLVLPTRPTAGPSWSASGWPWRPVARA